MCPLRRLLAEKPPPGTRAVRQRARGTAPGSLGARRHVYTREYCPAWKHVEECHPRSCGSHCFLHYDGAVSSRFRPVTAFDAAMAVKCVPGDRKCNFGQRSCV